MKFSRSLAGLAVAMFAATPVFAQEVVTLTMSNWVPPTHHLYESFTKLADETSRVTNGTLKIVIDKTAIAAPGGMLEIIKNGVRDMAWDAPSYNPGLFELARVIEAPFLAPDSGTASRVMHNWYFKHGFDEKEWGDQGVVLLNMFAGGMGQLLTSKHKVVLPDDAIGIKIRAAGPNEAVAKLIGMVPVSVPASKVQETLQRGAADGAFFSEDGIIAFNLGQYIDYILEVPGGFAAASFYVAINEEKFNSLSQEHQDALKTVWGVEGAYLAGEKWHQMDIAGRQAALDAGTEITVSSGDDLKVWQEKLSTLPGEWVKTANDLGEDGQALYDDFVAMVAAEVAK